MKILKWRTCETKMFKVFETYYIETYNITVFDTYLSCVCFYFITSLFPDSVLHLLQKPAPDLCCVVGLPPPLLIRIMTTSGNFWAFVTPRGNSWLTLCFAGDSACSSHTFVLQLELLQLFSVSASCFSLRTVSSHSRHLAPSVWGKRLTTMM